MFENNNHIGKTAIGLLIVAASLFCVLFGQGTHLHDFDIHIGNHFDVHAHVHAHESHDEPMQADHDHNQEDNTHRHEVSTASDIVGTLTYPLKVKPDVRSQVAGVITEYNSIDLKLEQPPTLFDLPPPRPTPNQYHLFSFSRRGPPTS